MISSIFVLSLYVIRSVIVESTFVQIDQGALDGITQKSRDGHEFLAFYGIPYAQPPIGNLRFQPPKLPPPSWQGTKNATVKPPFCPQMNKTDIRNFLGSEDCLFLQVFTRNVKPQELMPVLVFFHGGGFKTGGTKFYEGNFFMDEPLVMVTVNYRLGVFGFFSTGDSSYPGNYGLKDQVAALQWVRDNIRAFGGDPSAVTIAGQSAGAASVHFHTLSPASKGLFHRAIIQSGAATHPWSYSSAEQTLQNFLKFQKLINCSTSLTNETVACLLALPATELKQYDFNFVGFGPVIESFSKEGAFLPSEPNKLTYHNPQMPLLIGFTSNELLGLGWRLEDVFLHNSTDEKTLRSLLPKALNYDTSANAELRENITTLIKQLYFDNDFSHFWGNATARLFSDLTFKSEILDVISDYPGVKFAYEFDYTNDSAAAKALGAGHGEDLRLLFPFRHRRDPELTPNAISVSETMIKYWSNFVLSGNPNTPDGKLPNQWTSAKNDSGEYLMHITSDGFEMKKGLMGDKSELWEYVKMSRRNNGNSGNASSCILCAVGA